MSDGDDDFSETRARLTEVIAKALAEAEAADDEAAYRQAGWLTETFQAASNGAAAVRARIVVRVQDAGGLSLAKLGEKLGVSKARANDLVRAARRKDEGR